MDVGTGSPTAPLGTIQVQATGSSDAVPDATFLTRQGPGSVLFGMGAIDGNLINGGILRSYKATVAGSFQQTSSGTLAMQILGLNRNVTLDSTLGEHDWLDATGDVTLGGTLLLAFWDPFNGQTSNFPMKAGQSVDLITSGGTISGAFSNVEIVGLRSFDFDLSVVGGNTLRLTALSDAVIAPEAPTLLLLGSGIAGLVVFGQTKRA